VARRHNIFSNTIYGWISATKKRGSVKPLPRNEAKRLSEIEKRLESTSKENTTLKRLWVKRDTVNPRWLTK
jgi:transposase